MNKSIFYTFLLSAFLLSSCVSKKKYVDQTNQLNNSRTELDNKRKELADANKIINGKNSTLNAVSDEFSSYKAAAEVRLEQIDDYKAQIEDLKRQRDQQMTQVGDLTVLTKSANDNISKTIDQMKDKDRYINLLQAAKSKADSMNLALAINLKSVLSNGLSDSDVDIKVDKTVVYVDLSDKMLFRSGSSSVTTNAKIVLGKIAKIVESNPNLEIMVEGYTDSRSIKNGCIEDNWDLSVKRATSVVRVLEDDYNVDGNRLIAAGRGETNAIADNTTEAGRSMNRRTRIVLLPKIDQFYDLLAPKN